MRVAGLTLLATLTIGFVRPGAQPPAGLEPVPAPDLGALEGGVRQRLEAMHTSLSRATGKLDAEALGEAYGVLGQHYLAHELFDAAAACFANAERLQGDERRWPYLLGIVLQSQGELEGARDRYRRALELSPDDLPTLLRLGNLFLGLDDSAAAATLFRRVLAREERVAAAHYGLGKAAVAQGDPEAAVGHFERALELQPEASIVHYPLGQAYRKLGDLERAREHLKLRGRDEVSFPDPLGNRVAWLATGSAFEVVQELAYEEGEFSERDFLGFALGQLGEVDGAVEQLEEALRIRTEEAESRSGSTAEEVRREERARARIHYAIGGLLVKRHSDAAARDHFERALGLAPEMEDARIKLGNVQARFGDFEAALEEYSRVLETHPDSVEALLKRAATYMRVERLRPAIADLERVLALAPQRVEARLRLGRCFQELAQPDRAREHYVAALEADLEIRERARVELELGHLDLAGGALDAAVARYQRAAGLEPELAEARFHLATTLGRIRRYDESARVYGELLELTPGDVRARLGRATALLLVGREREARATLETGVAAQPESLELSFALARLLASAGDASLRDGPRAVELALALVRTTPTLEHAETLAMALAEAGRFEEAVEMQSGLLRQAVERGDRRAESRLREHLRRYETGRSCC